MDFSAIARARGRESHKDPIGLRGNWESGSVKQLGHFCWPPLIYPEGIGPGSIWVCTHEGIRWLSQGAQIVDGLHSDNYPILPGHLAPVLGPERWLPVDYGPYAQAKPKNYMLGDGLNTVHPLHQMGIYDWRPMAPYYVKLARELLDAVGGDWKKFTDQFDQMTNPK